MTGPALRQRIVTLWTPDSPLRWPHRFAPFPLGKEIVSGFRISECQLFERWAPPLHPGMILQPRTRPFCPERQQDSQG